MKDAIILFSFFCMISFGLSIIMIKRYLYKRNLAPTWQLLTGFIAPWNELGAYISSTKQEYGHIGIWLKLMIASFAAAMLTALILAIM